MRQIALPFPADARNPSRIVVGTGNAHVVDALSEPARWPFRTALLSGPSRSGKSLLARWFGESGLGDAVDDADGMDETALFHAWNRAQESGRPLLIVSTRPYGDAGEQWQVVLPDLASRLGAALMLDIGPPDDEAMAALIALHAEMRGIAFDETATTYLVGRVERSHLAAERLVAAIDRLSMERKQAPGLAIWREALEETMGPERSA